MHSREGGAFWAFMLIKQKMLWSAQWDMNFNSWLTSPFWGSMIMNSTLFNFLPSYTFSVKIHFSIGYNTKLLIRIQNKDSFWICLSKFGPLKFVYSEKAIQFCKISTVDLFYVVPFKSTVEILQTFVAFSEYINFKNPYSSDKNC